LETTALRDGHRLMMPENRVLRRIFELEREKVAGGDRKFHNKDHYN
jgi:hypothetical protein